MKFKQTVQGFYKAIAKLYLNITKCSFSTAKSIQFQSKSLLDKIFKKYTWKFQDPKIRFNSEDVKIVWILTDLKNLLNQLLRENVNEEVINRYSCGADCRDQ